MKRKWIAALALASLLLAMNAYAEDAVVQPEETPAAQTETAAEPKNVEVGPEDTPAAEPEEAAEPENPHELTTQSRWFISQSLHIRRRKVTYYDNVYAYNHGKYGLTPFA